MDFRSLRESAGMTLEQAAAASGYGIGTISGLENQGAGSARLRDKLREVYGHTLLKAEFGEADEFATRVQETNDAKRIGTALFTLRSENNRLRMQMANAARQLRSLADQLDPREPVKVNHATQSQSQNQSRKGNKQQ